MSGGFDPHELYPAPDWFVDVLVDVLTTNRTLIDVHIEDLLTNRQIRRLDERLQQLASERGFEQPKERRIHAVTASSEHIAHDLRTPCLIASVTPADRFASIARQLVTSHPTDSVIRSAMQDSESPYSLVHIASHLSALLAIIDRPDQVRPAYIRPANPLLQLFALFVLRPDPIEPSSAKHPFVQALVAQLRAVARPAIDEALTMDAGAASGERSQWPAELVDVVVSYL